MAAAAAPAPAAPVLDDQAVIRRFHEIWYNKFEGHWERNTWLGIPAAQNPMDVWVTQEIINEVKPDLFIELGSWLGGSAAMWATILEQVNPAGRVISVDIRDSMDKARALPIVQRRVEFVVGSSVDPAVVARIAQQARGKKVIVLLDSDHHRKHVLQEIRLYSPMVSEGSYLIVQDTSIGGHPVLPNWDNGDGGPMAAVRDFLPTTDEFKVDESREKMLFTFCPNGFLKRVKPAVNPAQKSSR